MRRLCLLLLVVAVVGAMLTPVADAGVGLECEGTPIYDVEVQLNGVWYPRPFASDGLPYTDSFGPYPVRVKIAEGSGITRVDLGGPFGAVELEVDGLEASGEIPALDDPPSGEAIVAFWFVAYNDNGDEVWAEEVPYSCDPYEGGDPFSFLVYVAEPSYVGIWRGPEIVGGEVFGMMTFVIDEDDSGNIQWFMHHENGFMCEGNEADPFGSGAWFGRGVQVSDTELTLYWDGLYCLDGTWHDAPGRAFEIRYDGTVLTNYDPDFYVDPGDGWTGIRVCDPNDPYPGTIMGTNGDDVINGTKNADIIDGRGGNDRIWGRNGDDIVCGGLGDDELYGNNGIDILWGDYGLDVLYGGFHTDGVFGNDDDDEVRPQAGHDFGYGGYGDDILDGFYGHDWLEGGPGDDDAWGRNGNDDLFGGTGDDFLSGGDGPRDTADGGDGRDTCSAETEMNCEG